MFFLRFRLSLGGPAALSQLVTTAPVTHRGRIEHHDYCSKQLCVLADVRHTDAIVAELVFLSTYKVGNTANECPTRFRFMLLESVRW